MSESKSFLVTIMQRRISGQAYKPEIQALNRYSKFVLNIPAASTMQEVNPVGCFNTPFYKFILNMRLLLQFPTVLSNLSVANPFLNSTIDKKHAFS